MRVFNKLQIFLIQSLGLRKTKSLIKRLAKYQLTRALKRYLKMWRINEIEKEKIIEMGMKIVELLGIGKPIIKKLDKESSEVELKRTVFALEYALEYGKRKHPWDFYVAGLFESGFESIFGGKYECEEVKCYAKGDDSCTFVIKLSFFVCAVYYNFLCIV